MAEAEQVKEYTLEDVQGHTSSSDCWLVIGNASNGASWKLCPRHVHYWICLPVLVIRAFANVVQEENDDDDDVRMKAM